ncbi:MAG: hypothetical protein CVU11_12430 [Bacteroidetes bacterium HGW-Bacteroidetes-6]|jgi:outer membrane protein TolC|nr:MAG: hypothetical protein CVU11_12430 [Bacteroidetes bacterium HGW-Bacteroidetes-6]
MWKKSNLWLFLMFASVVLQAQQLTLDEAVLQARLAYPLLKQQQLFDQASALKNKNINSNWMPTVSINAQATYQSDVTALPISLPGIDIPELKKDMYKMTLDVQQLIYDGGLSSAQRDIEAADLAISQESLNADLKKIELMTSDVYFSILTLRKSREQMILMQDELNQQISLMESRVKNGVVLQSSADLMRVEQLSLKQKISDLDELIQANFDMLGTLLSTPVSETTEMAVPSSAIVAYDLKLETPELKLFELNQSKLSSSQDMLKVRNMPMVAAFGQAGYGRPGLNMFTTQFDMWYLVGVKASWSLWKGGSNKREQQILQIQRQSIDIQREAYITKMELARSAQWQKIESLNNQLSTDEQILELRISILKSYESQLEGGVITATDYLNQLNNKTAAAITLEMHRIQLAKEQYNYLRTFGK